MKIHVALALIVVGCAAPDASLTAEEEDDAAPEVAGGNPDEPVAQIETVGATQLEATFTDLRATDDDRAILDHIVRLIRDTPAGEEIRAAIHSITVNAVVAALVDAQARGVRVQVVHCGHDENSGDDSPAALAAGLGASHKYCGHGGTAYGCISSDQSGIMHSKLFLFSKTKDGAGALRSSVSWFGSANMTYATGAKTWNNTITVYDDAALYDHFKSDYFADLWAKRTFSGNDFYDASAPRGYFSSGSSHITVYASPEKQSDLVLNRLNYIDADDSCRVRVAQAMIHDSRMALVDKLVALKRAGCKVWVAAGSIEDGALARLHAARIPVHSNKLHDKLVLVYSRYAGSAANRKLVFTGSHNWTASANSENDELFVKVDSDAMYDAYYRHFNNDYNSGSPL